MNFTTVTIPNLRFPLIDTYTISSIEPNQEYELRMATYSNRGLSPMSNSIEISLSTQQRSRVNRINALPNLDEILENITKIQNPSRVKHNTASSSLSSTRKSSDILYLTIGIIAGILSILILILISMCIIRLFQRKKLLCMFNKIPLKNFKTHSFYSSSY